jgi:hypothetical protein
MEGLRQSQLTSGTWNVISLAHYEQIKVYFIGVLIILPKTSVPGKFSGQNQQITDVPGVHDADISPTVSISSDTHINITQPPKMDLFRSDGEFIRTIGDRKTVSLDGYELGRVKYFPYQPGMTWTMPPYGSCQQRLKLINVTSYLLVYSGPESASVSTSFGVA